MSVTCFCIRVTVVYCPITKSCALTECISHISEDETTFSWLTHSRKPIRKIFVRLIYVSIRIDKFLSHITNILELYQLHIFFYLHKGICIPRKLSQYISQTHQQTLYHLICLIFLVIIFSYKNKLSHSVICFSLSSKQAHITFILENQPSSHVIHYLCINLLLVQTFWEVGYL